MFERLPFQMPEFLRTVWVSEAARAYWEPKIQAVSLVWGQIERATVLHGLRPGTLQSITPENLPDMQRWCVSKSLLMLIVGMEGTQGAYGNAAVPYQPGQPFTYRVYMGADPEAFFTTRHDNFAVGKALGFPPCCTQFFDEWWRARGWRDLAYPALCGEEGDVLFELFRRAPHANLLLRHLGVRPVFHLPCSFACEATQRLGYEIAALMRTLGYEREEGWAHTLLSMPMEWSSLHGVAMVVTPLFKLVYDSDPLPSKVTLRLRSPVYPQHGATSSTFPFTMEKPLRVVKRHLNGFTSLEAMEQGHRFILGALPRKLTGPVLDLGCGDGTLMRTIHQQYPETTVSGVESQDELAKADSRIVVANVFGWRGWGEYSCVLLAMQRLLEVPQTRAMELLATICQHAAMVLLYSYDGLHPEIVPMVAPFPLMASPSDGMHAAFLFGGDLWKNIR